MFYLENILLKMDWLVDEFNNWIVPLYGENIRVDYDRDSIEAIRDDRSKLITDLNSQVDRGIIDRNEARILTGQDERKEPGMDVPTVLGAVTPLEAATGAGAPKPAGAPDEPVMVDAGTGTVQEEALTQ